jgi:hypothetical protein
VKLTIKPESLNLWWGIYGFCEKTGWEDLNIFNDKDEKIAAFCLNTKKYLSHALVDLRNEPEEKEFVQAVNNYLTDNKILYWFYYNQPGDNFFEVPYDAPRNDKSEKPRCLDLWHPDETIDRSTIHSAVENFAETFLKLAKVDIEIEEVTEPEELLESYEKHVKLFGSEDPAQIVFSDDLIKKLSITWKLSGEQTLDRLKRLL